MRIVQGLESYPPDAGPAVVALGVFDGVHLGHREILGTAVARARDAGLVAVACTFEPHPIEVLQPGRAPAPIATLDERLELIAATGVDTTVVLTFTRALAAIEPETFVKDVVLQRLHAREIVVGFNHTFGRVPAATRSSSNSWPRGSGSTWTSSRHVSSMACPCRPRRFVKRYVSATSSAQDVISDVPMRSRGPSRREPAEGARWASPRRTFVPTAPC